MFSSGFRFLQALHLSIHHFCPTRMVEITKKTNIKWWIYLAHHSYLVQSSRTLNTIHSGGGTLLALHFPSFYPFLMSGPPTFPLRLIKLSSFVHFVLYVCSLFSSFYFVSLLKSIVSLPPCLMSLVFLLALGIFSAVFFFFFNLFSPSVA